MRFSSPRAVMLAFLPLFACGEARRPRVEAQLAGGETSEFSGGAAPFGYCPQVLSRTPLDANAADVTRWSDLALGQHELPLRWRREFPDDTVRGFEERTSVRLDITLVRAEDVECGFEDSYEASDIPQLQRRFELAVDLVTADGAVQTSFQGTFHAQTHPVTLEPQLVGGARLSLDQIAGRLDLRLAPGLDIDALTFAVDLTFGEQAMDGALSPLVVLRGPTLGDDEPRWSPVRGVFPAPDEGCDSGTRVPLDDANDLLAGSTPRAAYQSALARLPRGPISAAWSDASVPSLERTEVTLSGGEPTHACRSGLELLVYTSLRIESADGKLAAEPRVIAKLAGDGMELQAQHGWQARAEFEATSGLRDLDMGLAEYGAWGLSQSFAFGDDGSRADEPLRGTLYPLRWESYHAQYLDRPALLWCAGAECDQERCGLTPTAVEGSCGAVER